MTHELVLSYVKFGAPYLYGEADSQWRPNWHEWDFDRQK